MNCSEISTLTPLYLTGELESAQVEAFSAHLKNCTVCGRELVHLAAFDELLRTSVLAEQIDSSSVDQRVREGIRLEAGRQTSRRWVLAVAGIAAVLLVAMVGYRVMFSPGTKPLYAAAARDHRLEIVDRQPRKWLTDLASIEGLAGRQGLSGSAIASFAPAGYRLAQGRLCLLDGRVFLHLVYTNEAGNFSLFLRRPDDAALAGIGEPIHTDTFAAQHVAGFQHGQFSALIVTEQSSDTVLHLAKSAAAVL